MSRDLETLRQLPLRPCVGITLFNAEGLVFTGKRLDTSVEAWQMPQGGIDEGEAAEAAAFRELEEETGITSARILEKMPDYVDYNLPDELLGKALRGKYRGQRQEWYAMAFEGDEAEVNIVTEHQEFGEWRWLPLEELPHVIVPFKKAVYEQVVTAFTPLRNRLFGS